MTVDFKDLANAIRALSMDAVQAANSGHPGMPMGMADVATVLFQKHLKYDAAWPHWPDRDRFVLSAGHGSMLLYSLLHLTGYAKPTLDDIKNFRQLHSPCAGHPEFGEAPGIETTTGPLGQGLAMAVGMALGERLDNARHGDNIVDHHTYVIAGDGCLMEGVSQEAITLAGHLKLGKLIVLFDDNGISIDGPVSLSTSDDQGARFEAAGWHVASIDGHDTDLIDAAIEQAKMEERPSLIACKTVIGYGSPNKQGTAATHGAPLGPDEIALTRDALGWSAEPFDIPDDVLSAWRDAGRRGVEASSAWKSRFDTLPGDSQENFNRVLAKALPLSLDEAVIAYKKEQAAAAPKVATRKASEMALEVINAHMPETVGGSADLTGSNNTKTKGLGIVSSDDFSGRYIHYGIREFGMGAAMNGLALHGGTVPYGGTFLVFSDYARPAMRLSALMNQRVVYVMTHDSIGLGEDGPTHQPVEHVASLRAMPNMLVMRPADVIETMECWQIAMQQTTRPSVLALSRQGLPAMRTEHVEENLCAKGAYRLSGSTHDAVTFIATGSEVHLAAQAAEALNAAGTSAAVVSAPCLELFDEQDEAYKDEVLGSGLRVSVEAGTTFGWHKYTGMTGLNIGIDSFGASAPASDLFPHFGFSVKAIVEAVKANL
ncbi:MAG: transketolase [Pseudomonadota bacterium]